MSTSSSSPNSTPTTRQLPFYSVPPKLQNLLAQRVSEGRGPSTFGLKGHEHETSQWLTKPRNRDYVDDMRSWLVHLYGCGEKLCPRAFETKRISTRTLGEQTCTCQDWSVTESEGSSHVSDVKGGVARLEFCHESSNGEGVLDGEYLFVGAPRKVRDHCGSVGSRSTCLGSGSRDEYDQRKRETAPDRIIVDVRKLGFYLASGSSEEGEQPAVTVEVRFWQ